MKTKRFSQIRKTIGSTILVAALMMLFGCREEIDTSNRYTFVGNTVASFLEEHEDLYGDFIYILKRGEKWNLMKAYGTYTCFAPTNDAIERYLKEQDSIYWDSKARHDADGKTKIKWTGITSPKLEDMSDSMCTIVAQTHILPATYLTTEMEGDIVPTMNLNDRYLTMTYGVDSLLKSILYINGAQVIAADEEVENGVVHTLSAVMNPSSETVPTIIENMKFLSIFSEALDVTGLTDKLQAYKDYSYTDGDKVTVNIYNDRFNVPYPPSRYYGFTAFVEPDSVYQAAGIYSIDDLYKQCKIWYPNATDPDFKSENNALHKFISYHLLDRKLLYSRLTCYKITCGGYFNSESVFLTRADRYDYFETMQGTLLKVIRPLSNATRGICDDGVERSYNQCIFLNYTNDPDVLSASTGAFNVTCGPRNVPVNIRVMDPSVVSSDKVKYPNFLQEALNGSIHLIDHFLVYDEDVMSGFVLNGIIRIDFSSIAPEYTNNNIRWSDGKGITFADRGDYEFYIPGTYSDRIKYNHDKARLYYLSPHNSWTNYMGDECMCIGPIDISYRLPHVPPGTYEMRFGYQGIPQRGISQFYFDDEITGIPVDLRLSARENPRVGWVSDAQTDDNGVVNDKQMKNRGFLKGSTQYNAYGHLARHEPTVIRVVLTTKYLDGGDHWFRAKNVNESDDGLDQFMHDYIEFVPVGWLRNENISLEEKRK
ncbi:MAG: fasciclin domain-containing protein [Bacteroidaceae bacterium]|nr:fasciclin domain-containing protein [Bacteroidaceae bacterium]